MLFALRTHLLQGGVEHMCTRALLVLLVWRFFFPFTFVTDRIEQANYSIAPWTEARRSGE